MRVFFGALLLAAATAFAAPGQLDPTFGVGGVVKTTLGPGGGAFDAVVVQPDGKIVASGALFDGNTTQVLLARYLANGQLDPAFGTAGIATKSIVDNFGEALSLVLQPDGKYVAGVATNEAFALMRFNADGSSDGTFGTDGLAMVAVGDNSQVKAIARQSDGKLVAVGFTFDGNSGAASIAVARFNMDGTLDTNFGCVTPGTCSGYALTSIGGTLDFATTLAILGDDRILVGGSAQTATGSADFALVRYNTNGTLDATFGTGGVVTTLVGDPTSINSPQTMVVQADGAIVLAGANQSADFQTANMAVVRYFPNGAIDAGFGTNGVTIVANSLANAVAIQAGGKILLGGYDTLGSPPRTIFVRLGADGIPDAGFGTGGIRSGIEGAVLYGITQDAGGRLLAVGLDLVASPLAPRLERYSADAIADTTFNGTGFATPVVGVSSDRISGIAVQPDGRILATGRSVAYQVSTGVVARYLPNGSLDTTFGGTGTVSTQGSNRSQVAMQLDGRVVVVNTANNAYRIERLMADGSRDNSFGNQSRVTVAFGNSQHLLGGVAIQPDGRIVVAGSFFDSGNYKVVLARLNTDGSLDTSFNGTGKVLTVVSFGYDFGYAVRVLANGQIVVAGTTDSNLGGTLMMLLRYNADGSLDATYLDAVLPTVLGIGNYDTYAFDIQADGKYVIAGAAQAASIMLRVNADFTPDLSLGGGIGFYIAPGQPFTGVVAQPDGRIVLATQDAMVTRLSASAAPDPAFNGGMAVALGAAGFASAEALVAQPDGRVLVAGIGVTPGFTLARLDSLSPLAFSFPTQTGVLRSTTIVSAPARILGLGAPALIFVAGGEYCISSANGCACDVHAFRTTPSTVSDGQYVCVRHVSGAGNNQSVTTTVTVDQLPVTFTSITSSPGTIALAPPIPFGNQQVGTTGTPQAVTISNVGTGTVTNVLVFAQGGDFYIASTTCGATLAPLTSCTANIAFSPVQQGPRAGEIVVLSSNSTQPEVSATLTGIGTAMPALVPTLATSAASVPYGTNVTFTATVATGTTGFVTFFDGATFLGAATLTGTTATLTTRVLTAGAHSVTAQFSGNVAFASGTSLPLAQAVTAVASATAIQSSANPGIFGHALTLTATVTGVGTAITGNMAFRNGGVAIPGCVAVPLVNASASCTTALLVLGQNGVSAQYLGDGNNLPSTSPVIAVQVNPDLMADTDGDGIPDGIEPTEGRNALVKDNDIFASSRLFAMQQYRDFLGREGDAGGIQFYVDLLAAGTIVRANAIESFFNSPEFSGVASPIARLYFATFLRTPDYPGLIFQINAFRSGATLAQVANNFTLSPEFIATYGALDNAQFVALLYTNILGRTAVQAEIDFHVNRLVSGATRGEVLIGFSESPEYQSAIGNEVYVTMMYVGMLRRAPDPGGLTFWVTYMDGGNSGLALILGFLNAPEYHNRFLP